AAAQRVTVDRAGQRRAKADQMGAALDRVDIVGEGKDVLSVAVVPLHGDLDFHAVFFARAMNDFRVHRRFRAVQMLDKRAQPAFVEKLVLLLRALVFDGDLDALVQKRQLAQPLGKNVEAEVDGLEDRAVGFEGDPRAAFFGFADFLQSSLGIAALVALLIHLAVALDLDLQGFRERVDHGNADAVQAAGNFVGSFVEFAAGVKFGQHDFGGGNVFGRMNVDGNAAAVVGYGDAVIDVNDDFDRVAVPGKRLVDRVIDDFIDQMVQTALAGVADVHPGPFSDGFKAFENFDVIGVVFGILRGFLLGHFHLALILFFSCNLRELGRFTSTRNNTGKRPKSKAAAPM